MFLILCLYSLCHSHKPMTSSCKKLLKMRSFSFTSFCVWAIKPLGYYLLSHQQIDHDQQSNKSFRIIMGCYDIISINIFRDEIYMYIIIQMENILDMFVIMKSNYYFELIQNQLCMHYHTYFPRIKVSSYHNLYFRGSRNISQ